MTSGHSHMKLAQLCEDKGEACAGHRPSTSIWVLSSLGPGGTWDHTSRGGPAGIYCPLMVCAVQCRIHEARLHYRSAALAHLLHRLWSSHISSSETATQRWSAAPSEPLTRDTFCVVTISKTERWKAALTLCKEFILSDDNSRNVFHVFSFANSPWYQTTDDQLTHCPCMGSSTRKIKAAANVNTQYSAILWPFISLSHCNCLQIF